MKIAFFIDFDASCGYDLLPRVCMRELFLYIEKSGILCIRLGF